MTAANLYIEKTIDFVEENLKRPLNLDRISAHVGLSKFHLTRMFRAVTRRTLIGYVRQRKLVDSLDALLRTDMKIIDIAYEYAFAYEQSYIRAFQSVFRISPDRFRREKPAVNITERLDVSFLAAIGDRGILAEPVFRMRPGFRIVGVKHRINHAHNDRTAQLTDLANEFFYGTAHSIENPRRPERYVGYIEAIPDDPEHSYYWTSIEVDGDAPVPPGMESIEIPPRRYAVFKYVGLHHPRTTTIHDLREIYRASFGTWLRTSHYSWSGGYHMECVDLGIAREDYCELEIHIPIARRVPGK